MTEEIFDILPPQKVEKEEPRVVSKKKEPEKPVKKKRGKKFLIFLLFLVIGGVLICSVFSKAEIEIWPEMYEFGGGIRVEADQEVSEINLAERIIPGYLLEEENSFSQQFPASGMVTGSDKAKGRIRVYNDYSSLSQPLVATTRFMSANGLIFRAPQRISIPGKKGDEPGYVDIEVVADEPGPEYNIEATTFSIPGLAGTPMYTKFYAKSFEPMTGGFIGQSSQVTEEDLETAETTVIEKLKEEGRRAIEREASQADYVLLEDAFKQEIKDSRSSAQVGTGVDNFNFSARVSSKAIVFKEEDVRRLIDEEVPEDKRINEKSLSIKWQPQEIGIDEGEIVLMLNFSGKFYSYLSELELKKGLGRRNAVEAKTFLESKPEIAKAEVRFWPFWVQKLPKDLDKIKFKLNLD